MHKTSNIQIKVNTLGAISWKLYSFIFQLQIAKNKIKAPVPEAPVQR